MEYEIQMVRMLIGDVPNSPFYPLFEDNDIYNFLEMVGGSVREAARYAAISGAMQLAGFSTRERTGNIEVWNDLSKNYIRALELMLQNQDKEIPSGLMPWLAGQSKRELCAIKSSKDYLTPKLTDIFVCDSEYPCRQPSCGKC